MLLYLCRKTHTNRSHTFIITHNSTKCYKNISQSLKHFFVHFVHTNPLCKCKYCKIHFHFLPFCVPASFFIIIFYGICTKILCDMPIPIVLKMCYHIIINIYVHQMPWVCPDINFYAAGGRIIHKIIIRKWHKRGVLSEKGIFVNYCGSSFSCQQRG